jgi:hypothetical protein
MSTEKETTEVSQVEVNLDELLGIPGADNIMLPEEKKPSVFTDPKVDTSFLDTPNEEDDEEKEKTISKTEVDSLLDEPLKDDGDDVDAPKATGRPKLDKSGTAELVKKLIDKGQIVPFDDDKPIEEYTLKDFEELLEANFSERENKVRQDTPREFFEALPEELQAAAKYVADGGEDLRGLFRILAEVEEHRQLDPRDKNDQEYIVREYLRATNFGNEDEIEEEIDQWRDRGDLQAKALKFKPKLDKMQEHVVAQKLAQQEHMKKQQQQAAQQYMHNVYETLKNGDLGGVKLDKKTQGMLYAGLVQPNYPSISGKPTNMLGHLLEKYQYVEPRHDLIAEALWLLSDPDGYKARIKDQGKQAQVEKTVRQLKTEEARRTISSPVVESEEKVQRRIPRNDSFFKR